MDLSHIGNDIGKIGFNSLLWMVPIIENLSRELKSVDKLLIRLIMSRAGIYLKPQLTFTSLIILQLLKGSSCQMVSLRIYIARV